MKSEACLFLRALDAFGHEVVSTADSSQAALMILEGEQFDCLDQPHRIAGRQWLRPHSRNQKAAIAERVALSGLGWKRTCVSEKRRIDYYLTNPVEFQKLEGVFAEIARSAEGHLRPASGIRNLRSANGMRRA
jgi:hypothetical protein